MNSLRNASLRALLALLAACGPTPAPETNPDHAKKADASEAHDTHGDRTRVEAAIAEEAGIRVAPVAAGTITDAHVVQGLLTPIEDHLATVEARFPGLVQALDVHVGDQVRAGQTLARIESNLSLAPYAVKSPISGVVLARRASLGAVVAEGAALFEVANLSELWVDLHVFGADAEHIQAGASIAVTRLGDGVVKQGVVERILPGMATASQSTVARATLDNTDGLWRPGAAVTARITVAQRQADRVLPLSALQTLEGTEVVFVREGEEYEARRVTLGERDASHVEVLAGVETGEEVVVEQSFLLKADLEKSAASHEH